MITMFFYQQIFFEFDLKFRILKFQKIDMSFFVFRYQLHINHLNHQINENRSISRKIINMNIKFIRDNSRHEMIFDSISNKINVFSLKQNNFVRIVNTYQIINMSNISMILTTINIKKTWLMSSWFHQHR